LERCNGDGNNGRDAVARDAPVNVDGLRGRGNNLANDAVCVLDC